MNVSTSQPTTKQAAAKKSEKIEPMDFAADYRDLISTANKVFGEGKWNHTVVHQTLGIFVVNFEEYISVNITIVSLLSNLYNISSNSLQIMLRSLVPDVA